jgi:hypothetical protein
MKDLDKDELFLVNGGALKVPKILKGGFWISALTFIYDHWTEIKTGAIDGWNDGGKDL